MSTAPRTARRFAPGSAGPRPQFVPSVQQKNFLIGLEITEQHILLEARAGSGKSTTCREGARRLRNQRSIYCCFNKVIATEFQRDLPSSCQAATLHSLGNRMLRSALGDVQLEEDKVDRMADRYFPGWDNRSSRTAVKRLVGLCKNLLSDGEDGEQLRELAALYQIDLPTATTAEILGVVPEIMRACREQTNTIDFDDMIWLPVVLGLSIDRPADVVFVDEAQDLNPCQHAMLPGIVGTGRAVIVGDRFQSIYAFRGADSRSLETLSDKLAADRRTLANFPLTVTRRCPRRVVELARQLVPDLDHMADAPDGDVREVAEAKWKAEVAEGDMVLCRTNAPLVSAAYQLIRSGVRATVRGRDIGKGLLALIARFRARDVPGLTKSLEDYRVAELNKLATLRNPGPATQALNDRCDCLMSLTEGASTLDEVKQRAETMFSDVSDSNSVTLSSIHRAKGLERDHVVILRPDILPGPWAVTPDDQQQERNLAYVAVTRAKRQLTFAGATPVVFSPIDSDSDEE